VRMFVAAELRDWLLDTGFTSRMVSIAYR
jgi:hypothetical protein